MKKKLLFCFAAVVALTSCAQTPTATHPPVYRGEYYAFDVYPYGYKGYPAFPYYGAPFGYGGPAFAATEVLTTEDTTKEMRSSVPAHHSHKARNHSPAATSDHSAR
jgi:hypothetical protein